MLRTVISLPEDDKKWLDQYIRTKKITMTKVMRIALHEYRQRNECIDKAKKLRELLETSRGIWTAGDGLEYQNKIRKEWEK